MRKYVTSLATIASASLILVVLQGSAAPAVSNDDESGKSTLTFAVVFSPFNYTDLGQAGPSAADVIVFHDQLLQKGQPVGDEVGSCVLVEPSGLSNCTGVIQLSGRGTVSFSFVNSPPPHKILAVTGGSGRFRTARGDGTLDENPDGTGTLVLRLTA